MLKVFSLFVMGAVASQAFGAAVINAELDKAKENVVVDLSYSGGCKKHDFQLKLEGCAESFPVQCQAQIVDLTNDDFCEALISTKAKFNLKALGLTDEYYSGGSLTIKGDKIDGKISKASIMLPKADQVSSKEVACVTHTGSQLKINSSEKQVSITPVAGAAQTIKIVKEDYMVIETLPGIDSYTYDLEDGRKVVVEFTVGQNSGEGYYVRLNGEASPKFTCKRPVKTELE